MNVISWNVRGLRSEERRRTVGRYARQWRANVWMLQESMVEEWEPSLLRQLGGDSFCFAVAPSVGRSGGQVVGWSEDLYELVEEHALTFVLWVLLRRRSDGFVFSVASVYGPCGSASRDLLWSELRDGTGEDCWFVGGDFNVTLVPEDRPGGRGGQDAGSGDFADWVGVFLWRRRSVRRGPCPTTLPFSGSQGRSLCPLRTFVSRRPGCLRMGSGSDVEATFEAGMAEGRGWQHQLLPCLREWEATPESGVICG